MEIPADSDVASKAGRGRHRAGRLRLGLTTAGFGAALLIFVGVSWFEFLSTQRLLEAARWRAHTEDVIRHGGRTWAEAEVDRGAASYSSLPQMRESA